MKNKHKSLTLPAHKTKIICTIGPASQDSKTIDSLLNSGMNIARLNFSHGTLKEHEKTIKTIKQAEAQHKKIVPILADLPGVKIRIGELQEPIELAFGDIVYLTSEQILGTKERISINYPKLPSLVVKNQCIYLSDGFIELKVLESTKTDICCKVTVGGVLLSHKGVNVPGDTIDIDPITQHDLDIVEFGLRHGVDTFCISFIQGPEDIVKLRKHAAQLGSDIHIIAKIERSRALQNYSEILDASDGIMIARGDLGVETPIEQVPTVQKHLIREANIKGKPIIVATQMLKSMTDNRRPTRAEVTDVANAIFDGTDAIMLSEETAIGKYPVDTVKMMVKISETTEHKRDNDGFSCLLKDFIQKTLKEKKLTIADVISLNALEAERSLKARYILTPTSSGNTSRRISRFKPTSWILAFSSSLSTSCFLQFSYGIYPFYFPIQEKSWHPKILPFLKDHHLVDEGDIVLLTQGRFNRGEGSTDSLGIITIGSESVD